MSAGPHKRRIVRDKKRSEELALATTTDPLTYSQKKIEERRARVFELYYCRDFPARVIAESLGVSKALIYEDLRAIQDSLSEDMRHTDTVAAVGIRQAVYKKLLSMAITGHGETKNHRTKNLYILTALKVQNSLVTFESGVGLLPSKKTQIDLRVHRDVSDEVEDPEFVEAIKNPDSRRKLVQFAEKFERIADKDGAEVEFPFQDIPKPADVVSITTPPPVDPVVKKAEQEAIEKSRQAVAPPPTPRTIREPG